MLEKCDAASCSQIRNIGRQFCSSLDLKCIDWQGFFQHLSSLDYDDCECHQGKLLNSTIECGLVLKYPIRKTYQLAFLKYYISQTENFNIPFSRAYELYIKLLNTNSGEEEIHYKHYFIGEKVLSVQENNNFISSGTTGLRTWEAGIALANWCHSHPELLYSKEVLELGCGSGLTGIAVINSALPPTKYIFTDYHPLVLQQLKHNLDINFPGEGWPRNSCGTLIDVCEFNWEDVTENSLRKFRDADVFLAAAVGSTFPKRGRRRPGKCNKKSTKEAEATTSKYFNTEPEVCEKWIPPRSPYNLIQEDLYSNPWQLLIATIFLTKTSASKAIPVIHKFLNKWPTPESAIEAGYDEIYEFLAPLGLGHTRTRGIIRFSHEFLEKSWKYPIELYGIGKYGNDSYRIFCVNEWQDVKPDDIPLTMYRNWLLEHKEELNI